MGPGADDDGYGRPVAWGGAPWSAGLMAGVLTAVVAGVVTWGALAHARNN